MPATEQTWRDQRAMHVLFGITGLAMLGATIWMFAADHKREWKDYQRDFRKVEAWTTQARLDAQKTSEYEQQRKALEDKLHQTQSAAPPAAAVIRFKERLLEQDPQATAAAERIVALDKKVREEPSVENRNALLDELQQHLTDAKFVEDDLSRRLKFRRADLDVARSNHDLAVGEGQPPARLAEFQRDIDAVKKDVDELTSKLEDARTHRKELEALLTEMRQAEANAKKALDVHDAEVARLQGVRKDQGRTSKALLELPILDAFNSPLKIRQIWLPKLTLNNNFRDVARFDRCTTCHQGIEATAPGSAVEPGFKPQETVAISLATPAEAPKAPESSEAKGDDAKTENHQEATPTLEQVYGLTLAENGLLNNEDVTIEVVQPRSRAAVAQLIPGDVILTINNVKINSRQRAHTYLLDSVKWGQPLSLVVRRGVPQPYSSHPRLDLFVGSLSPHKAGDIGCTICHEGQGSATAFKYASHTPNSPAEGAEWGRKHGWFDNHHWIYPMTPERFIESGCLKCHHDVTELGPSERFPDPPAPKLMAGYNIVRQYGCFGCHEVNGFDGPHRRIGPDLRSEPNYAFAALELLSDKNLDAKEYAKEKSLAESVARDPANVEARRQLVLLLEADARRAADPATDPAADPPARLSPATHKLASVLADVESPGQYRKVGPSLRYVASKVDFTWLYNWIREPKDFRPTTKMPQFFGLHSHLLPEPKLGAGGKPVLDEHKHPVTVESPGLAESKKYEPIEIRAVAKFLLLASQPFEYLPRPEGVTEQPSPERGKDLFQLRGCLACHQHSEFPGAKSTQGPDLSRIGAKLAPPNDPAEAANGPKWLYSWVREPNRYHARTVMPNVFLTPIEEQDKMGNVTSVTDPAADITAYLLGSQQGWKPKPVEAKLSGEEQRALDDLALLHLSQAFTRKKAEQYLQTGIPESERGNLKGDEVVLVTQMTDANREEKKLEYVGRRTISKYGCAGCHDIPGFENSKPIGTALADWGRKDPSKLAFEQIGQYIARAHGHDEGEHGASANQAAEHEHEGGHGHLNIRDMDPDTGYMMEKLEHHQREGFIWQKLREPRSYDYKKTENKTYNERLRMPKFPFDQQQIEQVMTFVLGLVAEPPAQQYVYKPDARQRAIVDGKHLLDKFNCAGCHTLDYERFEFDFDPNYDELANKRTFPANEYEIFRPNFTPKEIKDSLAVDYRGLGHARIAAVPVRNEQGEAQQLANDDNPALTAELLELWKPALINGQAWLAVEQVPVPKSWITLHRPPTGGDLARLLHPTVLAKQRTVNPNAKFNDAWGWLPPPLMGEGHKVQTKWLHDFLLDPYPIRPAAVLRMPKFNMSASEASKLADYFAVMDRAQYPYEFDPRTRESHLASEEAHFPGRLTDALKIVTNGNFCVKCHKVGDYVPQGTAKDLAPQLAQVYRRLRPEFLEAWLSNPKRLLPYTGMPVNFPKDKNLDPKNILGEKGELITEGDSSDQLEAVVDLLLNFDEYTKSQYSIKPLIQAPTPTTPPAATGQTE